MSKNTVLSYKDWMASVKNSATLKNPYNSYLDYVNSWYQTAFKGKSTEELTAEEYSQFLLTLNLVTDDPYVSSFMSKLNYDNSEEVKIAIPYFAKNLKNIAKYVSTKRDDTKYASIDYSYLGSNEGLSREIYKNLIEAYISSNSTMSNDELLSNIRGTSIEIEELYDDNEYHDKSPKLNAYNYFDMDQNSTFYSDLDPEYLAWLVKSGFNPLYSNNDTFNPEVSGTIPLSAYMDYTVNGEQTTHYKGNLSTSTMGEKHFYLSGDEDGNVVYRGYYSDAKSPWNNLSNRYFPTIAMLPLIDYTYSKYTVGGFSIPSKLGISIALGQNKYYKDSELTIQGSKDNFPDPSIYSNGYSFSKEYQDAPITYNAHFNWIDIQQASGRGKGILSSTGKYQEMTPYQTSQEAVDFSHLGMNNISDKTDPWFGSEDKNWEDPANFPADFRNIYDIEAWYSSISALSGVEDQWGVDIYGNNYALYKDASPSYMYFNRLTDGKVYVRGLDGKISSYQDFFETSLNESIGDFDLDHITRMDVFNDIIVMEDINGAVMAQIITLEDGKYVADDVAITLDFESGEYRPFDYCFDDRTNTLYVARYENVPVNGFFEFIIYKFESGRFISVYNSRQDTKSDINNLRTVYSFTAITDYPSMSISSINDKMHLTYLADPVAIYTIDIAIIMTGTFHVDEVVVVEPASEYGSATEDYAWETRHLIKTMASSDKVTLFIEGETTNNKYLQCIPL